MDFTLDTLASGRRLHHARTGQRAGACSTPCANDLDPPDVDLVELQRSEETAQVMLEDRSFPSALARHSPRSQPSSLTVFDDPVLLLPTTVGTIKLAAKLRFAA
jgi:hypothetical protein